MPGRYDDVHSTSVSAVTLPVGVSRTCFPKRAREDDDDDDEDDAAASEARRRRMPPRTVLLLSLLGAAAAADALPVETTVASSR